MTHVRIGLGLEAYWPGLRDRLLLYGDDVVLMGHDGPGHLGIAQDKIEVRPLEVYQSKMGAGLSVEMSVQHGPVTLPSIVEDPARGFVEAWNAHDSAHHCAIGVGHLASTLAKVADLLNLRSIRVC